MPHPIDRHRRWSAQNYDPLPVTIRHATGSWVTDDTGRRFLDMLSAYSALNFGHRHPRLLAALTHQLDRVTLTSRAFTHELLEPFCRDVARLTGTDQVLPMNTGAEAVETAIKAARKWGYEVKGVTPERARIVACEGNFHGRTTTIVGFSSDPVARDGFGPATPGFDLVPYGDAGALAAALTEDTVAFLVEPIQGEAGVRVPPDGYLAAMRDLCTRHGVLLVADEIQSGLGRTGYTFACDAEGVAPDLYVLGKALGGGLLPVSAVAGRDDVMSVFTPGTHGSTFGGNPLACAVGREVVAMLEPGTYQERAARLGAEFLDGLRDALGPVATEVRGRGLWAGIDLAPGLTGRKACERLLDAGILAKETHGQTLRLSPPLVITRDELVWALERIAAALAPPQRAAATA